MERTHDNGLYQVFEASKKRRNSSSSSGRLGNAKMSDSHTNWSDPNRRPTPWDSISPKARLNIERVAKEAARAKNRRNTKQERRLSISSPTVSSEDSSVSTSSNSTTMRYRHSRSSSSTRNGPIFKDPEIFKYLDQVIQKHANRLQMEHQRKPPQHNKNRRKTNKDLYNRDRYSSKAPLHKVLPNKIDSKDRDEYTGNIFMESLVNFCAHLQDTKLLEGKEKAARDNTSRKGDFLHRSKNVRSNHDSCEESSSCYPSKTRRGRPKHSPIYPERRDSIIDDIARLLKKLYFKSFDKLFDNKNTPIHGRRCSTEKTEVTSPNKILSKDDNMIYENWKNPSRDRVCRDKCVETDYALGGNINISPVRRENISAYCKEAGDGQHNAQRLGNQTATYDNIRNDFAHKQDYYTDNAPDHFNTVDDVSWPRHRGTAKNGLEFSRRNCNLIDHPSKHEEQRQCMEKMAKLWEDMLVKFKDVTKTVGDSDRYIQEAVEQQRTEMTETVHLWRECMRRYELLNRDLDDKDCAYQEQVKNQKEEMHEQTKMWQDCLSKYREINENLTKLSHKISTHKTNPPPKISPIRNPLPEPPPRPPPPMIPSYPPQYPPYAPGVAFPSFYPRPVMRPPPVPMWQPRFPPDAFGQGQNCAPCFRRFHEPRPGQHCSFGCRCQRSKEKCCDRENPVIGRCYDPRSGQNCNCCGGHEATKGRFRDRRTSPGFRVGRGEHLREARGRRDSTPTESSGSDSSGRERDLMTGTIRRERGFRSDAGHKGFEDMKRREKSKHSPRRIFTSARDEPRRYCNR